MTIEQLQQLSSQGRAAYGKKYYIDGNIYKGDKNGRIILDSTTELVNLKKIVEIQTKQIEEAPKVYIQPNEPENKKTGDIWVKTKE